MVQQSLSCVLLVGGSVGHTVRHASSHSVGGSVGHTVRHASSHSVGGSVGHTVRRGTLTQARGWIKPRGGAHLPQTVRPKASCNR